MTAEMFDRLLYTDCRPGTGRRGASGFQVQAQSSGVDSAQSDLAVGRLLYEVQLPWLRQRRPVQEFPLGFAHASGEAYGTAQSRYLGKVATGGRDGNHLADCLLTRDPNLYGSLRPAQLWRSPLWRAEPWDSRDCPRFDADGLEPGPLTVDEVADWAIALPERRPILSRLLSLLEDPDGKRVVIVADEPDEAMAWIAAATLLMPARRALDISFKVFSSVPLRAEHRVVAAPASLFLQLAPGRASQAFVIDATTCTADDAEVSDRAAFFTGQFTAGGDPYDIIDAVELAEVLGGGERIGDRDAMLTAWALTRPASPPAEPEALFRWLSGAGPELLGQHGPSVAAMLVDSSPPAGMLRWIDGAVADKRLDLDPAEMRVRLLAAELAEIRDGHEPPEDPLPAVPLDTDARRDAESELSSAILLGTDQQADLLLCLARRHAVEPDLAPPLQQRLRNFVTGWIDHPGAYHPDCWALRVEILDCAHDELRHRVSTASMASVADTIRRMRRYFADRADLSDPLDCHIQASLIANGDRAEREPQLRQLLANLGQLAQSPVLAPSAATAATGLQRALIEWNAVDGEVAVTILTEMPSSLGVEPVISERAVGQLIRMSEKPSRELLDLLAGLDARGKAPSSGPLATILKSDRYVRAFLHRALEDKLLTDRDYFDGTVLLLRQADAAVVRVRLGDVLTRCLQTRHPSLAPVVLASLKSPLPRLIVERWGITIGTRDLVSDGLWCVSCLAYDDLPPKRREQLAGAIRSYAKKLSKQDLDSWYKEVARQLWPDKRAVWRSVFVQEESRSRISSWINRDGG
jgi:hypothetical protein